MRDLIDPTDENADANVSSTTNNFEPGENETVEKIDGRTLVTKQFEDFEMTYELGKPFLPTDIGYQVKLNDPISGNMPFRENVSRIVLYFFIVFFHHLISICFISCKKTAHVFFLALKAKSSWLIRW